MVERVVTVVPSAGLHARPASTFVQTANEFESDVEVGRADDEALVNARSMLAVTGLNVREGEAVRIVAEGADATATLDALEAVLASPVADADGEGDDDAG